MLSKIKIYTPENLKSIKYIDVYYKKYPDDIEALFLSDDVFNSLSRNP